MMENFSLKLHINSLIEKVYRLLIIKNETFTLWKIILIQDEYKKYQNSVSFIRGNY